MTNDDLNRLADLVDEKINKAIEPVKKDLTVLKQDVGSIKQDVTVLKQDLTVVKRDVTDLKQDVNVLKQDVTDLKQDVNVLKQDVTDLKQDVTILKQDTTELKKDLKDVKNIQENNILPSVVYIEKHIKAYKDSYQINNANSKKLEKRVEALEENAGIIPPSEFILAEVN